MAQPDSSYTQDQIDQFEFRSEINDICSNVVDFTVFRKDEQVPMMGYLVATEGNMQTTSSICHIGNTIPHYYPRPMFSVKGKKYKFFGGHYRAGQDQTITIGQTKRGLPLRPDCRIGAAKIIFDIEVEDFNQPELMLVRYPVEDGDQYQEQVRQRKKQLVENLQCSYAVANEIANKEFGHLMVTKSSHVSKWDPGNSRKLLKEAGYDDEAFITRSIEFFQNCDAILVKEIPMKTIQKFRYGSGNCELGFLSFYLALKKGHNYERIC